MERKHRCCIVTCKGELFDLAHKFPRSNEMAQTWLQAIDNPYLRSLDSKKLSDRYQVCARHFRITDYRHSQSRSLNKLAVPSLNLKNLSQLHLARDSTPLVTENLLLEIDPSIVPSQKEPLSNNVAIENEHDDSVELIECVENEKTSSETDIDSINNQQSDVVEEKGTSLKVTEFSTVFAITHPKYKKHLSLNAFWLRLNCVCPDCFDSETKRKKITFMDVPRNIQPKAITQLGSFDTLLVDWKDGHYSTYEVEYLFKMQAPKEKHFLEKLPFDSNTFEKYPQIEFSQLICFDDKINFVFENLIVHGFVCVTGISTENSSMAKLALQRLFPHQQTIHFEPFNEIHSDICTNFTCANTDCGLKCFFATHESEIILVDGLNIIETLRYSDALAFSMLTNAKVPLKMRDKSVYHKKSVPIIYIDNEMEVNTRIQLDMHRIGSLNMLPQAEVQKFYDSLELLMTIIRSNEKQILLTLEPGTLIILDNWRVLHKLSSHNGVLQCYLSRNDYIGRSKFLGLL